MRGLKNVIESDNVTLDSLSQSANESGVPTQACNESAPMFNGTQCILCANGTYYYLKNLSCYEPEFAPNYSALRGLDNVGEVDNYTLDSLENHTKAGVMPTKACNESAPMFNGKECIKCPEGTFYLLTNFTCYTPKIVTNVSALIHHGHYIEKGNATLMKVKAEIAAEKYPTRGCPEDKPILNGTECAGCTNGTFYQLQSHQSIRKGL